ncbi:hypothetical protein BALOs_0694 [Halobacteriovorax sp. BALOs_7]|uniref:hypothetical protein n=1 Tax=Halobacteriovorax sp. BALOs_7 TaxID=2109558 RepID=UPI000EA3079F|nr:hypothetical protein [Halobacteriovorax sp. BALOs_7]AYF43705.1 hypothetical protein BALOs_0694 [Halobacteriovorax sp. BALOs_7]
MSLQEIKSKLKELAFERTIPFCYGCYIKCPSGVCKSCGTDDLMRHLEGVGVEYGTDWVIESIVEEELEAVDLEEIFSQMIEELYGEEIQIGFISKSTSLAIKELDPIAWNIARGEYIDSLIEDESIMEVGCDYYWIHDLESL